MEEEIIKKHYEEYKALCIDAMFTVDEAEENNPTKYFRALISDEKGTRLVDRNGIDLTKNSYKKVNIFDGYLTVLVDTKWQILRLNGEPLSDKLFEKVGSCKDGFISVEIDGYWNYIGIDGNMFSEEKYTGVTDFKNGVAQVFKDKEEIYIKTDGSTLFRKSDGYTVIAISENGYPLVRKNKKVNFIDPSNGNFISKTWFDDADLFRGEYARVKNNGKWNLIDTKGSFFFKESLTMIPYDFSEGFCVVYYEDGYNFIDKNGKLLSSDKFSSVSAFENGYAIVEKNNKWNLIDKNGNYYFEKWLDYKIIKYLQNGNVVIRSKTLSNKERVDNHKEAVSDGQKIYLKYIDYYNIIDRNGNLILSDSSSEYILFVGGYAKICKRNELLYFERKFNYTDIFGNLLSDNWFEVAEPFSDGYGLVAQNGKYNYIDSKGFLLFDEWLDYAVSFKKGYAQIKKDGFFYLINIKGTIVSEQIKSNKPIEYLSEYFDDYTNTTNVSEEDFTKSLLGYKLLSKNIKIKYKPFYVYENHIICSDDKKYYLYNTKDKTYYVIGEKTDVTIRDNIIINRKTKKVYYLDSVKEDLIDITSIYWKKELNKKDFDYNYIDRLTYTEFKAKMLDDEYFCKFIAAEKIKLQSMIEERRIAANKARIEEEAMARKYEEELAKKEREKKLKEALNGLKKYISVISELSKEVKVDSPKVPVTEEDILVQVGDHKEISEEYKGVLKFLDLGVINFKNVLVSGIDFQDTNASINPQEVYNKDMSNGNFIGLIFGPFTHFNGVNIKGAKFGKGYLKESALYFVKFDGAITDDKTFINIDNKQR